MLQRIGMKFWFTSFDLDLGLVPGSYPTIGMRLFLDRERDFLSRQLHPALEGWKLLGMADADQLKYPRSRS